MPEEGLAPIPYGRQSVDESDIEAVTAVLRSRWLTTGPALGEFERALATVEGVGGALAVSSGSAALTLAYRVAGVGPGTEVVTSPLTFVATANAALALGARLRFADIDAATGTVDPASVDARSSARTVLWAPVDYAGHPADYTTLRANADRRGVALVADACHALGARLNGRSSAEWADAAAYSFHPVKAIATGEGGALLTRKAEWRVAAARLRDHGLVRDAALREEHGPWYYEAREVGYNFRLSDLACALGSSQLRRLPAFLDRRRTIAARYLDAFADLAGLEGPSVAPGAEPAWHLFVLRVRDPARRRPLVEALLGKGIGVQLHYRSLTQQPLYREYGIDDPCPRAEDFSARALSIPLFPALSDHEVERVIDEVSRCARELL